MNLRPAHLAGTEALSTQFAVIEMGAPRIGDISYSIWRLANAPQSACLDMPHGACWVVLGSPEAIARARRDHY